MAGEKRRAFQFLPLLLRTLALGILPAKFGGMIRPAQYRARKQAASFLGQPLAYACGTAPALLQRSSQPPIRALCPPSTGNITPVMNRASSDARKSAA